MRDKKENLRCNMQIPFWMLFLLPISWLIVLPVNFITDSIVLLVAMLALKIGEKKLWYKRYVFKVFAFGMLADLMGSLYLAVVVGVLQLGTMGDELFITLPAVIISAVFIYIFNYFVTFKQVDKKTRRALSLTLAIATAPYLILIPSGWVFQ